ncbi:hypothetical protein ACFPVX_19065 [Cohnella faecalis]|uniref:Uncharacterized protein n=1 Tax=Cohnella faecalis TaxID=2315694 RepID=A0A398CNF6_9BACL|nr:hypothetical protein [Cohnella faecalis]RIE01111.1 hypothetical protein D3H35_22095 [Cohnella faecalis]
MKKMNSVRGLVLFLGVIAFAIPVQVLAEENAINHSQALTSAPQFLFTPFTVFDPNYTYLEKGQGYLTYEGNGKVNIWGETYGTVKADEISVQLTLQRWTGTVWVDAYYAANQAESNSAYVYSSISHILVSSGYYYRTKSYHWIRKGATTESGYRYSSSYLIP